MRATALTLLVPGLGLLAHAYPSELPKEATDDKTPSHKVLLRIEGATSTVYQGLVDPRMFTTSADDDDEDCEIGAEDVLFRGAKRNGYKPPYDFPLSGGSDWGRRDALGPLGIDLPVPPNGYHSPRPKGAGGPDAVDVAANEFQEPPHKRERYEPPVTEDFVTPNGYHSPRPKGAGGLDAVDVAANEFQKPPHKRELYEPPIDAELPLASNGHHGIRHESDDVHSSNGHGSGTPAIQRRNGYTHPAHLAEAEGLDVDAPPNGHRPAPPAVERRNGGDGDEQESNWGFLLNYRSVPTRSCRLETTKDDVVLWAVNAHKADYFLHMTSTSGQRLSAGDRAAFRVVDGATQRPMRGVTVASADGAFSGITDAEGNVSFALGPTAATHLFQAEHPNAIRSSVVSVVVSA